MSTNYLDNYYARLGISKTADITEIQNAYRRAARQFHPDASKKTGANEIFLLVQQAYDTLADNDKRRIYDATLPPDIEAPPAIMVNALYSRSQIPPGENDQVIYVLLDLMSAQSETDRLSAKPPLNVCLVLDTSTSMTGSRLGQVLKAATHFIEQLEPHDILSVASFNDRSQLIIPAEKGQDIQRLVSRLSTLQTRGGTEILQGLRAGIREVQRNLRPSSINHVVLITDGRTYGDEEACLQLAEEAARRGIPISAIGIGEEWHEDFIDRLVAKGGGSSVYADRSTDIHKILERRLTALGQSYANNVRLHLNNETDSRLKYAFRVSPEPGELETQSPVFLGSIPLVSSLSVLLEFELNSAQIKAEEMEIASGELSLDIPSRPIPSSKARFGLSRPVGKPSLSDAPPQTLVNAIGKLSLYRMQERAREELESGDTKGAAKRLRMLATHLLSAGEKNLAQTVLLAAEELNTDGEISEKSGKQIKYGTRSLIGDADLSKRGKR